MEVKKVENERTPKVSIVIPFFNQINWLGEAVESIRSQTYKDYEIIIVNDGSLEDDRIFLESYRGQIRYFKNLNKGPGAARNYGIQRARGKYIAFLDSDDLWLPTKLEKQVELMEATGAVWSHTCYSIFYDHDPNRNLTLIDVSTYHGSLFPKCFAKLKIGTPCVMVSREYLEQHPLLRFSEEMRYGQDGYFWCLLFAHAPLHIVAESLSLVRRTGRNAVSLARVHLKVRSGLWRYLVRDFNIRHRDKKLDNYIRSVYRYCSLANSLYSQIEQKLFGKSKCNELISKALYFPAYVAFHLYYKFK